MKIFITGGGGFLGFAIVQQLQQEGHEIIVYSRNKHEALEKSGIVHHTGNISDYRRLKTAMKGCEAVFHVASKVGLWGNDASFYETNVTGTQNIIKACLDLRIPYLVYTSSASVVFQEHSAGKNESLPYPEKFDAAYPRSKAIAEQAVLKANGPDLITCSLRPHLVWGPGDTQLLPRLSERRRKGQIRLPGNKEYLVDTTYIDNAARAHVHVFEKMQTDPAAVAGKAYFISQDEPIAIRVFINRLLNAGGLPAVSKTINPRLAYVAGWLFQTLFRLFRISAEPPITVFLAKQLSQSHWYDISTAKMDFGYRPTISIDEGMKRLKTWMDTHELADRIQA